MEIRYWAGIGSRETPAHVKVIMSMTSMYLYTKKSYVLRTGGAVGADAAFAKGCPDSHKVIYTYKDSTVAALEHASKYHPNWNACNEVTRKLHARNSMIILGPRLDTPVFFCVCWTPKSKVCGGTGQGIRICKDLGIPVYNLGNDELLSRASSWLEDKGNFYIPLFN
jgi:hypothetical protein